MATCMICGARPGRRAKFCSQCGAAQPTAVAAARTARAPLMERRHLTVLFCDLAGSTLLSSMLDPEELADIIFAYREVMQAKVAAAGGTVVQYLGDGVLAYFGYPRAQDDEAARAVSAALAMLAAVPGLNARFSQRLATPLNIRIGVHSGLTLVEVREGSREGLTNANAIGKTPNVAARLQELATPGTCLVSAATHTLTSARFDYESRGEATLKGVNGTVAVFRPVRDRTLLHRRSRRVGTEAVIGRVGEFEQMLQLWRQTQSGSGAALLLLGDAGIGKTYLANQLASHVEAEGALALQFHCQLDATQSPFRAVLDGLRRQLFITSGSPDDKASRLERVLRRTGLASGDLLVLLCELFSLPIPGSAPRPKLTTEGRLQLLRDLLFDRLDSLAHSRPVLVMVENIHWADPSSQEWLSTLVGRVGTRRLMVVATTRPHFRPAWFLEPAVTRIQLERLDATNQERILAALEASTPIDPAMRQVILDRSDGVPLFLEELFKVVAEAGTASAEYAGENIPGSLRGMLTSRLDRLGAAKPIALAASVIGRHFTLDLLRALHPTRTRDLEPGLTALIGADIVRPRQGRWVTAYSFKHALLRDAAYESLPMTERRALHAKLTHAYLKHAPEIAQDQPEVIAHHASLGALQTEALGLWQRAGTQALERSAYREGASHFGRALAEADAMATPLPRSSIARLCTDFAAAMIGSEGFAAPEVERLSVRAYELFVDASDPAGLAAALSGLTTYYQVRGPLSQARQLAESLFEIARQSGDPVMQIRALRRLGWCRFCLGDIAEGKRMLTDALNRYDLHSRGERLQGNEIDARVIGYVNLGWAESFAGDTERALAYCTAGLALATDLGERPMDMAYALCMSAATQQTLGDHAAVVTLAERARGISAQNALPYWRAWATILLGWGKIPTHPDEAVRTILRGLAAYRATGARLFVPHSLGLAAEACLALGRIRMGLSLIEHARRESRATQAHFSDVGLLLARADLLRAAGRTEEAEAEHADAARLARSQGALKYVRVSVSVGEA